MQFRLALLTLALVALGTTGCQRYSKSERYLLIAGNTKVPYWKTVMQGFNKAAADYNVSAQLQGPEENDAGAEADAFSSAIDSRPAGILVSVLDANRMRPLIDRAMRSGIPVVTVDSDAPQSARLFFIGTNNYEAGLLGGRRLAQLLNGKGNVVFFTYPAQPNLAERLKGYMDVINEHPGMKVVDVYDIKSDTGAAFDKTREYVARTGSAKIDAFVSLESVSGKDVSDALKRANIGDRTVIAMDVSNDVLSLIRSGEVKATVSQKPYTKGYVGLKSLLQIHDDGRTGLTGHYENDPFALFPNVIDTGASLVDKENVETFTPKSSTP